MKQFKLASISLAPVHLSADKPLAPAPAYLANNKKIQSVLRQYAEQAEDLPG